MTTGIPLSILAMTIGGAGLAIAAWCLLSVFLWAYGTELPGERGTSDTQRLARAGSDLIYGLGPMLAGMVVEAYAIAHEAVVSGTTYGIVWVGSVAYVLFYFRVLRPRVTAIRLDLRARSRPS